MVYTADLKSAALKGMRVRVPPLAPIAPCGQTLVKSPLSNRGV